MTLYTESVACHMYKTAILDQRDKVETCLQPRPWVELKDYDCLKSYEIEDLKKLPGANAIKIKKLVDLILTKNDLQTYANLSKVIYTRTDGSHTWKTIFPFADNLDGIPVIEPKKALPQPSDKPVALWLAASETEFNSVCSVVGCRISHPKKEIGAFTCQEFVVADNPAVTIHIAYPSSPTDTTMRDPVDLLYQFSPRPHIAIMTGTCCANTGEAGLGDVCVITPQSKGEWGETSLMAEIQHMLEVWRLQHGSLVPEDLKPPQSVFQKMVCLARIHMELQVPVNERSCWFKELELDLSRPLSENSGVRRCVPNPDSLLKSEVASHFWSHDKTSPLLYFPCDQLCNEAKSSMQFSSENHSFVSDPKEPEVLFGRASRYKQSQGRMVCCPRVADFYKATLMVNKKTGMQYIAALGVSSVDGQDCREKDYEQFASTLSIHIMSKIVNHLFEKMHTSTHSI